MNIERLLPRLLLALLAFAGLARAQPHVHGDEPAAAPVPGTSLYQLGVALDPAGSGRFALETLRGAPVVVTMFYSTCTTVCPMISLAMQRLAAGLSEHERAQVRFLMVSFDAERDTPARLETYAAEHHLARPPFIVAHAAAGDVRAIAAALGIRYRQLPDGSFSHSSLLTLLDADGVPTARSQVLAAEDPGFAASLHALVR